MGTRNITFVKQGDKKVVAQYCQWDGYPTGRGGMILEFVKNLITYDAVDEFKKRIAASKLVIPEKDANCTYTGAPYRPSLAAIFEAVDNYRTSHQKDPGKYPSFLDAVYGLLSEKKLNKKMADYIVTASRDSGNYVLDYLMDHCPDGLTFYADQYTYDLTLEGDWQIVGVYLIDLDKNTVSIAFYGDVRTFSFEDLASMPVERIAEEMEAFEKEFYGE